VGKQILLNVSVAIKEGKLGAFQAIAREMIETSRKEPGTLGYEWFLSSDGKRCQVIEPFADEDALLAHLARPAVQEGLPKLMGTASVTGCQVYGDPGSKAKETLGGIGAEIFFYWDGLGR